MRVDLIGHASLLARSGGLALLSDPWWAGGAYRNQWFPYPLPVPERYDLSQLSAIYISHAHEDHLHRPTLEQLDKRIPLVIPRSYDPAMRDYLRRIGFLHIREVPSGGSLTLGTSRLTLFTHLDDSLLVLEAGDGEVLVNANDALHSARTEVIEEYCRVLRRRFPRIDYLLCGYGGASYFPNCIHVPGKDDQAVARGREALFLRNFALIVERLQPRLAVPFAAHFVLTEERTWWISAVRLAMGSPAEAVKRWLPGAAIADLMPGEYVEDGVVHARPWAAPDLARVRDEVHARYPRPRPQAITDEQFAELVEEVRAAAQRSPARFDFSALVKLWDYPDGIIAVSGQGEVSTTPPPAPDLVFETRSDLLRSTIRSPFGRDLISIGYGADVQLRSREAMARNPHERLLDLLAPATPRWRERLRRDPARTLGFLLRDPSVRLSFRRKLSKRREPALYDIGDWATA